MTMPHLHNCKHQPEGWCLSCVGEMHDRLDKYEEFATFVEEHGSFSLPELMKTSLLLEEARKPAIGLSNVEVKCPNCKGHGEYYADKDLPSPLQRIGARMVICWKCQGTGKVKPAGSSNG